MKKDYYSEIYSKDTFTTKSNGWIQWKGTDACIDIYCSKCNNRDHIDGTFLYFYTCPECGTVYALGQNINLIELTKEQIDNYVKQ